MYVRNWQFATATAASSGRCDTDGSRGHARYMTAHDAIFTLLLGGRFDPRPRRR